MWAGGRGARDVRRDGEVERGVARDRVENWLKRVAIIQAKILLTCRGGPGGPGTGGWASYVVRCGGVWARVWGR